MKFFFTPAEFVTPSPVSWSLLGNKLFSRASSELPSVGTCAIDHHPGFFSFFLASPAANRAVGTNNTSKHICRKEREAEIRDKAYTDKGGREDSCSPRPVFQVLEGCTLQLCFVSTDKGVHKKMCQRNVP